MSALDFVDTHSHLTMDAFQDDLNDTLDRAMEAKVQHFVTIGASDGMQSNEAALNLAKENKNIFCSLGIHPHEAHLWNSEIAQTLKDLAQKNPHEVLAWGEIGLDYHYMHSPKETQMSAFQEQIDLAFALKLPIIIHTREAQDDTLRVLQKNRHKITKVVVHCFTGDETFAQGLQELDAYVGLGGVITFRSADPIRQAITPYPLDRILLETDCPFMAPVPYRGKRNEPAYVPLIAKQVAEIKNLSVEEIAQATTQNAQRFFAFNPVY